MGSRRFSIGLTLPVCLLAATTFAGGPLEIQQMVAYDEALSPGSAMLMFDAFDDQNGDLTLFQARIKLTGLVRSDMLVENTSAAALPSVFVTLSAAQTVDIADETVNCSYNSTLITDSLSPSDGVPGSGPDTFASILTTVCSAQVTTGLDLEPFVGIGALDAMTTITGGYNANSRNVDVTLTNFRASGTITLTYIYFVGGLPCPADCSPDNGDGTFGNGMVTVDDLVSVINSIGDAGGPCDNAPVHGDGTYGNGEVNVDDIVGVINAFGMCP
jgi:hypothetical protein